MSGTLHGRIEMNLSSLGTEASQLQAFVQLVQFFNGHPGMTRIASRDGGSGSGVDVAVHSGAFVVYEWIGSPIHRIYFLMQVGAGAGDINSNGGGPSTSYAGTNADGIYIAFAIDTTGGNPWKGTTLNNNADTKATPVWGTAGGDLLIWPRQNSTGGAQATNKEYLGCMSHTASSLGRCHILSDNTFMLFANDIGANGTYDDLMWFAPYIPDAGLSVLHPFVMASGVSLASTALPSAGTAYEGGISGPSTSDGVLTLHQSWDGGADLYDFNSFRGSNTYLVSSLSAIVNDTITGEQGRLGRIDPQLVGMVANVSTHDRNADLTRTVFGSGTPSHAKVAVPWDGATVPGSGATQGGVTF
jgi:hypothetical protein